MAITFGGLLKPGEVWSSGWYEHYRRYRYLPWDGPISLWLVRPLSPIARKRAMRRQKRRLRLVFEKMIHDDPKHLDQVRRDRAELKRPWEDWP